MKIMFPKELKHFEFMCVDTEMDHLVNILEYEYKNVISIK